MLLSVVSVLVVAQSSSEVPEGLMNNPVYSNIKFHENPSCGSRVVLCRRTDTTKLIVAFHNSGNQSYIISVKQHVISAPLLIKFLQAYCKAEISYPVTDITNSTL